MSRHGCDVTVVTGHPITGDAPADASSAELAALARVEAVQPREFGGADDLHFVGVDDVEIADQRRPAREVLAAFEQGAVDGFMLGSPFPQRAEAAGLGLGERPPVLVGTVPAQHSYGFESTFLLALHGGCSFWSGKPFYPQDVVEALQAVPRPRMLVTTPFHLSALLASDLDWPALDMCLSATAPLGTELAARAEQRSGAPVHEIYGSTESGQLACRRTTDGPLWHLLPGVVLEQENDTTYAREGHVEGRVPLSDIIELQGEGRFLLHGRHADLINSAGKRSSLAYLNHQLCAIDGVLDGAFFLPDSAGDEVEGITRLTAFVVAPGVSADTLQRALRQRIDRVFLPRPLVLVDALPRNSTGKLPRTALLALYQERLGHGRV